MVHLKCQDSQSTTTCLTFLKIVISLTLSSFLVFNGDRTNFIPKTQLWTEGEALSSFSNSFPFGSKLLCYGYKDGIFVKNKVNIEYIENNSNNHKTCCQFEHNVASGWDFFSITLLSVRICCLLFCCVLRKLKTQLLQNLYSVRVFPLASEMVRNTCGTCLKYSLLSRPLFQTF